MILASFTSLFTVMSLPGCNCNCDHGYYKLCNDQCVMYGSGAGDTFDAPCSDNVSFMMAHKVTGDTPAQYEAEYLTPPSPSILPMFHSTNTSVAMHTPIFPDVTAVGGNERSESITFDLSNSKVVKSAHLYIRIKESTEARLRPQDLPFISSAPALLYASWIATGPGIFERTSPRETTAPTPNLTTISYTTTFSNLDPNKFTYITYKFEIEYTDLTREDLEITFALQDYHRYLPTVPAPVYAQGSSEQLVDILFIPARDHGGVSLGAPEVAAFRKSIPAIIRDVAFYDPTLRFFKKQFNFWINKEEAIAIDYNICQDCCHTLPPDIVDFELKALLHRADQRDFTDNCSGAFSAELNPERTAFLHELGHAAFWLMDEYPGTNGQESRHYPNNWNTRMGAQDDATFRHKTRADARLITY
jgi:hypothetical protein